MSSTKKDNHCYFGMKAHIGEDTANGLVHAVIGTATKVPEWEQAINLRLSSLRATVEVPFRVIRRQFEYTKVRYRGLEKSTAQLRMLFALLNL